MATSYFQSFSTSSIPSKKLLFTAALSSALTAFLVFSAQDHRHGRKRRQIRDDIRYSKAADEALNSLGLPSDLEDLVNLEEAEDEEGVFDDTLIREFLARNIAFLGHEQCMNLRSKLVVVVGLGGVGSACATMLCRSGIGRLRLIDFDQVSLSSLNRHAHATLSDVGTSKVTCSKRFFKRVAPWVKVDARAELFSLEDASELLSGNPDWVIDCIDNIASKVHLLQYCKQNNIKVFSAMGAASKCDPSRIQICDLSNTFEDPLARAVRRRLKLSSTISSGIPIVYSTERTAENARLLPLDEKEFQKGKVEELSALEQFRVRILPCLGPLPGMFGQAIAAYIVSDLGGLKMEPLAIKHRPKVYRSVYNALSAMEQRLHGIQKIPFSEQDIEYLVDEQHRGRSIVSPEYSVPTRPTLARWKKDLPLTWSNCVLFEREDADKHEKRCLVGDEDPETVWGEETAKLVSRRQDEEQATRHYRL